MAEQNSPTNGKVAGKVKPNPKYWLVYIALLLAGMILLADAANITYLQKWSARLGIAFVYSAVALLIGNGRKSGIIAAAIIWVAAILTFIF